MIRPALLSSAAVCLLAITGCEKPAPADTAAPAASGAPADSFATDTVTPTAPDTSRMAALPQAVDPQRLALLMPSQVGDLRRTSLTSESDGAMGLSVSRAQAVYGTGPQAVTLLLVDVGSGEGARLMGLGVPPTGRLKGQPVHRTQTSTRASVRMQLNGRYVVEAFGNRVGLDLLDVFVQTIAVSPLPE